MNKLFLCCILLITLTLLLNKGNKSSKFNKSKVTDSNIENFKADRLKDRKALEQREFEDETRIRSSNIVKNIRYRLKDGYNHGQIDLSKLSKLSHV